MGQTPYPCDFAESPHRHPDLNHLQAVAFEAHLAGTVNRLVPRLGYALANDCTVLLGDSCKYDPRSPKVTSAGAGSGSNEAAGASRNGVIPLAVRSCCNSCGVILTSDGTSFGCFEPVI